jgi:PAS domain S-box-containing protein
MGVLPNQETQHAIRLIEASLDPFATINTEGEITDLNAAFVKITGLERDTITGSDFTKYFTEPHKAKELYQGVFEKEFISNYPLTFLHTLGEPIDVMYNASLYKDNDGNVLGVFATARDVTEQKRTERELKKSLEEVSGYKLALDASAIVSITDENGIISYANDNFCKISKYEREELVGQNHRIINSDYHSKSFFKELWGTISDGKIWRNELRNKAKDGTIYWVDTTIVPFVNEQGKAYRFVSIRTDITARKLLSNYSLSLIEASRDPLFTISPDGKIMDVNNASTRITELAREDLIGTDFKRYFTEPEKAFKGYKQVFEKGFIADFPLTILDGHLTDLLFNGSEYKDDKGNVLGAVFVARDITEQKRIEKEINEAKISAEIATVFAQKAKLKAESAALIAEEAVKAKQQFLSNMSHEIRTPMNAIIGFTKVVLKTDLTAKQKEYLSAIKISGDALIVLINDILDLAKVDSGKMTFEKIPFKLKNSISSMLHLFETKIQERNLRLIKEYDRRIPEVLIGDPVRLHQIILNLVSNAVKFTTEGSITVSVRLAEEDDENVKILFSIRDTGIGISKDKISNIFDDFQQATSGTTRLYGGTGLGLAIVKRLIEPQGGRIHVESSPNEGSDFSFILPFKKTHLELDYEDVRDVVDLQNANIKVLVVEDIEINQLLMKTLLDDYGFDRDIASNGKIAIEKLQSKSYDIVLMDLQMPIMNGFEATDYIRNKLNSKIPIIALTADVTTVDVAKCRAVGMNDYIAKPVDERLLYNKIINLVKKPIGYPLEKQPDTVELNKGKIKYTDLSYLKQRTKSNPVLMMEMISLYLEQTPALVSTMKKSMRSGDWETLDAAVHKMLPSFSIMGISNDFELKAKKIQALIHSIEQKEPILPLVLDLEMVCEQACKELTKEYESIKKTEKNESGKN